MAFTAEQQQQIASIWNDPNIPMAQKMQAMTSTGVGVADIAAATGADPNAVAYTLYQNGATGTFGGYDSSIFNAPAAPQVTTNAPQAPGLATTTTLSPQQQQSVAAFLKENLNNPQAVIQAMTQYGVGVNDAAQALGVAPTQFASWLVSNGAQAGFGGYNPTATDYMVGFGKEAAGQTLRTPIQDALAAPNVVVGPFNGAAMDQMRQNYAGAYQTGQQYLDSIRQQQTQQPPTASRPVATQPSVVQGLFADTFKQAGMTPSAAAAEAAWNTVTPFGMVGQMDQNWAKNVQVPMTPVAQQQTTSGGLLTGGGSRTREVANNSNGASAALIGYGAENYNTGGTKGSYRSQQGDQSTTDYGSVTGDPTMSGKSWGELSPTQQGAYIDAVPGARFVQSAADAYISTSPIASMLAQLTGYDSGPTKATNTFGGATQALATNPTDLANLQAAYASIGYGSNYAGGGGIADSYNNDQSDPGTYGMFGGTGLSI